MPRCGWPRGTGCGGRGRRRVMGGKGGCGGFRCGRADDLHLASPQRLGVTSYLVSVSFMWHSKPRVSVSRGWRQGGGEAPPVNSIFGLAGGSPAARRPRCHHYFCVSFGVEQ
ncbi:hypothetical protein E2C01_054395 [Portunus trituberculatus]|uniref:Uncharacterized protein n=1 Tax=Portunus trituberculatus TaxID=210409 RepID=A0A5B7GRX2_PORTR|nr:hypothetical protein [Portunus trituberculatus]